MVDVVTVCSLLERCCACRGWMRMVSIFVQLKTSVECSFKLIHKYTNTIKVPWKDFVQVLSSANRTIFFFFPVKCQTAKSVATDCKASNHPKPKWCGICFAYCTIHNVEHLIGLHLVDLLVHQTGYFHFKLFLWPGHHRHQIDHCIQYHQTIISTIWFIEGSTTSTNTTFSTLYYQHSITTNT